MNVKSILVAMAAIAALASCSSDETENTFNTNVSDHNVIRINALHPSQQTRVTSTGFESGDKIGVYVTGEGAALQAYGNRINNGCFTYDGSVWKSSRTLYWNEGKNDVYAYYPYQAQVDDTEEFGFTVQTDQSTAVGYGASDFLWAKAAGQQASAEPVSLQFAHVMSRAIVELVKGSDYEGDIPDDAEVWLHNTVTTATVDLSAGSAGKDGYASVQSIKMQRIASGRYAAIVVPQRIDSRRPLVEIVMGNISYLMEGTMAFRQGTQHTLSVTITSNPQQAEIEIGGGIGNWE